MGILWFNGTIYTMRKENETVEAVFTEDGLIKEVGNLHDIENKYKQRITKRIDLKENVMFPGFVDSHMHLIGHGETLIRLDLSNMKSKAEVLSAIRARVETTPEGSWIIGEGWNENLWEDAEVLTKSEIDEMVPHHPVLLKRVCRHAMVVNSVALEKANLNENTVNPIGGLIEKDKEGKLNGVLKDKAQDLMIAALPEISQVYLENALRNAIQNCWKLGLVGGHTEDLSYYGNFNKTYQAFINVIEEEKYKFRAHLLVHHEVIEDWKTEGHSFLSGTPFVEFGAMKIFADGALGGRTALLSHPYADDPTTHGVEIHSQEKLHELVEKARSYGLPIAVHTIGDLAFEYVLHSVKKHPTVDSKRDRFIHAQLLRKDLIEEMKKHPIVLDIQPRFVPSDFPWVIDRVGQENMTYNYAWKTLLEEGIHCAGGSDAPIEPVDPLLGIHAAVTRTKPFDLEKTVYQPEQCLSPFEAVSLFTKGSAYACHHENDRGLIDVNFTADFTVLNKDILTIQPDEILSTEVYMTVINEEIVFTTKK
ncbi:putative amidohydrolase YtcJ [Bacillus pakistanensis]|uniref:Amidohydrolase YtcJ n=1 Tax=Rossellomorea pakistanensis TaxID=992288 RepID=A0ABS2NBK7_9BACI|nr:amidohydrolase [Bacillus pakistanensis]MBM7584966.1 putative amidohydrolase YtcJ [Bacillus pakistanensis]